MAHDLVRLTAEFREAYKAERRAQHIANRVKEEAQLLIDKAVVELAEAEQRCYRARQALENYALSGVWDELKAEGLEEDQ